MALVVARFHEPRQCQLLERAHRAGIETKLVAKPLGQLFGQHHVPNAESTSERLRERVRVNHAASPIEGRERRHGTSRHAELTVEVIFDKIARPGLKHPADFPTPALVHQGVFRIPLSLRGPAGPITDAWRQNAL